MEASKKKMKFPSAFSILFIILLIAIGLTWLIPSGSYSKLSYDSTENHFIVKTHGIPDQMCIRDRHKAMPKGVMPLPVRWS